LKHFYKIHHSKTLDHYDIEFFEGDVELYQGETMKPAACFTFNREELSKIREIIDSLLGDNRTIEFDKLRREVSELQSKLERMKVHYLKEMAELEVDGADLSDRIN